MTMDREDFFNAIKDDFFKELTMNIEDFKATLPGVIPIFGELETEILEKARGKAIRFIDRDDAQIVLAPEGIDLDEVDTDMSTVALVVHLDKDDIITMVEHSFGIFTPANKSEVLFYASLIGKKISFE
jgi:hypothetical protein